MLQQTQVIRVAEKFPPFVERFPSPCDLAQAPLSDVLEAWLGLGYNRRAKFLHQSAQQICKLYGGQVPAQVHDLKQLAGIGDNTAKAIAVYAYGQPHAFVETNIRTVFIHHFFEDRTGIDDKEIMPLVEASLDRQNPRLWYWALMDYGSWLKKEHGNASRRSSSYYRQSKFEGSFRQKRAAVLRCVLSKQCVSPEELAFHTGYDSSTLETIIDQLRDEGFISYTNGDIAIA
jgi:A/G-specific adenine glycosylase